MQDCKGFFKLFFCIIPKAASDGGEKKHTRYFCWPRIIVSFISPALRFQCGKTLEEKLTFGSDPMTRTLFYLYLSQISFHFYPPPTPEVSAMILLTGYAVTCANCINTSENGWGEKKRKKKVHFSNFTVITYPNIWKCMSA